MGFSQWTRFCLTQAWVTVGGEVVVRRPRICQRLSGLEAPGKLNDCWLFIWHKVCLGFPNKCWHPEKVVNRHRFSQVSQRPWTQHQTIRHINGAESRYRMFQVRCFRHGCSQRMIKHASPYNSMDTEDRVYKLDSVKRCFTPTNKNGKIINQ